ncbi:MAG: DMT family transporter [Armatimonadetes bacterium]|nr:DMT family transporter [Armatimonadota bacterium]
MIPLVLGTLASASFNLVARWAQIRKANLLTVGAINYTTAALVFALLSALLSPRRPSATTLAIGVCGGACYVTAYLFLLPALRMRGVSIASALVRLSVLVPIGLSLVLWNEQPTLLQTIGIVLAVASLPLLGYRPGGMLTAGWREYSVLGCLFLLNGLCGTTLKVFQEHGNPADRLLMLMFLFATAAGIALAACVAEREPIQRRDWAPGLLLGACNVFGNLLLLVALHRIAGVIVFPFSSSAGLLYTVVVAHRLWGERMIPTEKAGILLAVVAVVLVVG